MSRIRKKDSGSRDMYNDILANMVQFDFSFSRVNPHGAGSDAVFFSLKIQYDKILKPRRWNNGGIEN